PMMHGCEKSDLAIVAMKPANKAKKARCGGVCRGGRSGVGGAKGGGQGEYASAFHPVDRVDFWVARVIILDDPLVDPPTSGIVAGESKHVGTTIILDEVAEFSCP